MKSITKKISVLALSCCSVLGFAFAGCTEESGAFNIELLEKMEWTAMYANKQYDIMDIIEEEEGASYSIKQLFYFDESFERHDIAEHGETTFTQTQNYDVVVEIEGEKKGKKDYEVVELDLYFPPQSETGVTFEGPFTTYYGGEKSSDWAKTGTYSCHIVYDEGSTWLGYSGFVCDYELEEENTITFSMKSDEAISKKDDYLGIYILTNRGSVSFTIDILAGEHDYEFELTSKNEKNGRNLPTNTTVTAIAFYTTKTANMYVDDVKFIKKDIEMPKPQRETGIMFEEEFTTYYGGEQSDAWAKTGSYSCYLNYAESVTQGWPGYAGFNCTYELVDENAISFSMKSDEALSKKDEYLGIYILTDTGESRAFTIDILEGEHDYEFTLTKQNEINGRDLPTECMVKSIAFYTTATANVYVDDVKFIKKDVPATPDTPTTPDEPVGSTAQFTFESGVPVTNGYYGGELSTEWAATGEKSWKLTSDNTWETYAGFQTEYAVGSVNTMKVTINSTGAVSRADGIYLNVLTSEGQKSAYYKFEIQEGVQEYEITLDSTTANGGNDNGILQDANCTILNIAFFTNGETVYIDDLSFVQK